MFLKELGVVAELGREGVPAELVLGFAVAVPEFRLVIDQEELDQIVAELVAAVQAFHTISTDGCPFGKSGPDKVLVHGDACLPNFIYKGDTLSGYIDLGDMSLGSKEIDLAASVWSLQYNLGKGYGASFLEQYGVENVTEETVESLRLEYEEMQKEWFPEDYQEGTNT